MEYDFEKLAKEIVVQKLKDAPDSPALAAEVVRKLVVSGLAGSRAAQEPRVTVAAACRGAMSGMLLIEKDLPKTAVALLGQMAVVAQESNLDPAECMTWAMEGIAPVVKLAPAGSPDAVRDAIEETFMGAGAVFDDILRTAGA
ncbi:MAG TPA: hypothetical protein VH309_08950 [Elusimicrobiota bacterium]|jgi:hypothetical protein|nr:hypothetical protein [Elusimicrobiota bacterium]